MNAHFVVANAVSVEKINGIFKCLAFKLDIFTNNDEASMMLNLRNRLIRGRLEQLKWISLYTKEQKIARSC